MCKAKCSEMMKFWAIVYCDVQSRITYYFIFDRDRADKHIATMSADLRCKWHTQDYWNTNTKHWSDACERIYQD
jgi:hypothetical protein